MTIAAPQSNSTEKGLLLPGLDGSNPLGFLAALGLFRVIYIARRERPVRMGWKPRAGAWAPVIGEPEINQDQLLQLLDEHLERDIKTHGAELFAALATDDERRRRAVIVSKVSGSSLSSRESVQWISAIASDSVPSQAINQLQTARRDYYYGNLKSIMARAELQHLERAIFHPWDYEDALDNQSIHVDPSEDRRHAYQWHKPSGDPSRSKKGGMLGANRLAIEAIPLFTSLPEGDRLHTVGFTGARSTDTRWTWPIWRPPINLQTAFSLLCLPELQNSAFNDVQRINLSRRGIAAVYRSSRILVGKTPNFTPARAMFA